MTKVKFLYEKEHNPDFSPRVFAFFPEEHYFGNEHVQYREMFTCYAHVGQHSACHIDYANECKEAVTNDYMLTLLPELINQGYDDLVIMNKQTIQCHRSPTERELKFGEGAMHHRDFPLSIIGLNKKGDFKNWFIAPDDKLRYYTK